MTCPNCNSRKAKRACPALNASICTVCCATGREETLDCPLTCEYLRTAHRHEGTLAPFDIEKAPNRDVSITEGFLEQFQIPMALIATALADAAIQTGSATDYDAREALAAVIDKYRNAASGAEAVPPALQPVADAVREGVEKGISVFRRLEMEAAGKQMTDEQDLVRMLVFLQRLEFANNNGRRLSRAFLDFIHGFRMPLPPAEAPVAEATVAE